MSEEKINELVDLMFNFDEKELEKETDFLKEYKKIREQNKELQKRLDFMIEQNDKKQQVLDKIKEMTKDLFETEYEGIYKKDKDNCCEKFYLLEELNKLLEEIE